MNDDDEIPLYETLFKAACNDKISYKILKFICNSLYTSVTFGIIFLDLLIGYMIGGAFTVTPKAPPIILLIVMISTIPATLLYFYIDYNDYGDNLKRYFRDTVNKIKNEKNNKDIK